MGHEWHVRSPTDFSRHDYSSFQLPRLSSSLAYSSHSTVQATHRWFLALTFWMHLALLEHLSLSSFKFPLADYLGLGFGLDSTPAYSPRVCSVQRRWF